MIKRYRLIKDLPEFKIGDIFESGSDGGLWTLDKSDECRGWMMVFRQKTLDKYPNIMKEWFEPIEDAKADPIFDDEKVSKAIRAWLSIQVQPIESVSILCSKDSDGFFSYHLYGHIAKARIVDGKAVVNNNLLAIGFDFRSDVLFEHKRGHDYPIVELCRQE